MRTTSILLLIFLANFAVGCSCSQPATDSQLITAVKKAARADVSPAEAEEEVCTPAAINTSRPEDLLPFEDEFLELDTTMQSEAGSLDVPTIAYWIRPGTWIQPHVVGLVWQADGSAEYFFGILYHP